MSEFLIDQDFIERAIISVADPIRIRILQEILEKGHVRCCDMVEISGLSQPTCSHHIKLLTESNLIESRKEGRYNYLTINKSNFTRLSRYFENFSRAELTFSSGI